MDKDGITIEKRIRPLQAPEGVNTNLIYVMMYSKKLMQCPRRCTEANVPTASRDAVV